GLNPYAFCENSKHKPFCQKLCLGRTVLFALLCGVALKQGRPRCICMRQPAVKANAKNASVIDLPPDLS
ncbi:hypothetical protein, partial [Pseudoflavonifractor phocaeensis]|uniref:hypothetical protein n=1 Tax=Pseudoflavonifractor phocaeensis TaxID=1870988 RepID=UPI0019594346